MRFLTCCLLLTCASALAAPHPAVCRVAVVERGGEAYGSGTLVDVREEYGLVITNWHVVREATGPIRTIFPGGFTSEARPLKLDETWDLAALVIWRPPLDPVSMASAAPRPGDRLTICGYGGGDYLAQTGRCTEYYSPEVGQPLEIVELNVQARQGDSGGPIFNDRGEIAGVLFGAARGSTLGSFGPRVRNFLATLAPNIGVPETAVAASQTKPAAIDPFLVAEQTAPQASIAETHQKTDSQPQAVTAINPPRPDSALSDRSAAPQRVVARKTSQGWFAPTDAAVATPFTPQSTAGAEIAAMEGIDWKEDGRTLLAVLGVASLAVAGMRMSG